MLARYEGAYDCYARVVVMGDRAGFAWQDRPQAVQPHRRAGATPSWKKMRIRAERRCVPTTPSSSAACIIDLTGLPPTAEQTRERSWPTRPRPAGAKREKLIDALVGSEGYIDHWTNKWADHAPGEPQVPGPEPGAKALRDWIRGGVKGNKPYDKFCYARC